MAIRFSAHLKQDAQTEILLEYLVAFSELSFHWGLAAVGGVTYSLF